MLRVELACQEFGRDEGHEGRTAWPIDITEDQLAQLMRISGVFTPNTRTRDQLDGIAIWSIKSLLMLVTVLQSWQKRQPWMRLVLEVIQKEDRKLKRDWNLRMIFIEEPEKEIELLEVVGEVNFVLLPGEIPNRDKHRCFLRGNIVSRAKGRKRRPFNFNEDEISLLVGNIGQEDHLWY